MAKKTVRTRMAPSPTGEYHIGHIRTLLYNYAYARQKNGQFILRIEDTDRARYVEGAVEKILNVIKKYGFDWDEGPFVQSERLEIYEKYAKELVEKGTGYYCFCSPQRLEEVRAQQKAQGIPATKYDRHCRNLPKESVVERLKSKEPHVVRLRVPDNKELAFDDVVYGKVSFNSDDIDDTVLIKSDGYPTYHFGVVVDDHLMNITHVMRGNDWISSTPKHVLLYEAFGWELPVYIHLPNLKEIGANKKLSKRFGPVSAQEFLDQGYLPEALINFVMLLGWNPGTDKEIFTLKEFIKEFSLEKIHKTDLVAFDRKKLEWLNGQYIQKLTDEEFVTIINNFYNTKYDNDLLIKIAPLVKSRIHTLAEFEAIASFYFKRPDYSKLSFSDEDKVHVAGARGALEALDIWELEKINEALMHQIEKKAFKTGKFFMSLRMAIAGSKVTPPLNESLVILRKEEVLKRLSAI